MKALTTPALAALTLLFAAAAPAQANECNVKVNGNYNVVHCTVIVAPPASKPKAVKPEPRATSGPSFLFRFEKSDFKANGKANPPGVRLPPPRAR